MLRFITLNSLVPPGAFRVHVVRQDSSGPTLLVLNKKTKIKRRNAKTRNTAAGNNFLLICILWKMNLDNPQFTPGYFPVIGIMLSTNSSLVMQLIESLKTYQLLRIDDHLVG